MSALVTKPGRRTPARLAGSAILAAQSDERLVELVRDGHERAFEAIVARYRKPLVRFSGRILPESRAEDAVQQAFLNAHAALLTGDEPVQLKPWLYTITRNSALNLLRQNGWDYDEIPADFDGVRRPDQVVEQRLELEDTIAAVNELPQRQRDALVMREFEGRSYQEIGLALGAADGAVRQLLNRARGTLREALSLLMPPPLVARVASSLPPSDGRRTSEILAGLGVAGLAKAGATAVVAGSLVVGAAQAPLPIMSHDGPTREEATLVGKAAPESARANALARGHSDLAKGQGADGERGTDKRSRAQNRRRSGALVPAGHRRGSRQPAWGEDRSDRSSGDDRDEAEHRSESDEGSGSGLHESEDRSGAEDSGSEAPTTTDDHSAPGDGSGTDYSGDDSGTDDSVSTAISETSGSGDLSPSTGSEPLPDH